MSHILTRILYNGMRLLQLVSAETGNKSENREV